MLPFIRLSFGIDGLPPLHCIWSPIYAHLRTFPLPADYLQSVCAGPNNKFAHQMPQRLYQWHTVRNKKGSWLNQISWSSQPLSHRLIVTSSLNSIPNSPAPTATPIAMPIPMLPFPSPSPLSPNGCGCGCECGPGPVGRLGPKGAK